MAAKGLTESWNEAMAALTANWELRGLVRGPRQVDPQVHGAQWMAWATAVKGGRASGNGDSPQDALLALTAELRRLSR